MILRWLSKFWPILILVILCGIVAWKNVIAGTYLTGWDNLHTEFDFKTNIIDRGINGVWQYYQGLGVPSGNAHVADLPRQIVLWAASWIVPQNLIRYGYHLTAWLGGGIGLYFLILKMLTKDLGYRKKQVVALVGSIFYLFNLGTLQNFYAPYESFSHFYLMLPWLIFIFLSYLQVGGKKKLLWLALVNLIAVPLSYIPTIFIVYMLVLGIIVLSELIASRFKNWKRVLVSGVVILAVNSFWLLPFAHFVMNNTKEVVDAKINRIFTQEAFLRNEEYGELKHSLVMEGFWFDTTDMTQVEGQHDFMMRSWMDYIRKPEIEAMLWALVAIVMIGYMYALVSHKRYAGIFAGITLVGLFALINTNWPSGEVFRYLQEKLPLFAQVFRLPYTKFIFLVIIGYSVGVAWFVEMSVKYVRLVGYGLAGLIVTATLLVQKPVFEGHFFYDNLRLEIPSEYFALFKFFQNEDRYRGRVANLPQPTFWGWTTYGWGYRGSGFPWYGIPQPILDRNFDVWSPESEQYYSEISNAIYDNDDRDYFLSVLDKYGIDYVWIDGWVINPQKPKLLDMEQVEKWLIEGDYDQVFMNGRQVVYKRNNPIAQEGWKEFSATKFIGQPVITLDEKMLDNFDFMRYGDTIYERIDLPKYIVDRQGGKGLYRYLNTEMKSLSVKNPELNRTYNLSEQFPELTYDERVWSIREINLSYESEENGKIQICLSKNVSDTCYYKGVNDNTASGLREGKLLLKDTTSPSEIYFTISGNVKMREIRFGYFNAASNEIEINDLAIDTDNRVVFTLTTNDVEAKNCYIFGQGVFDRQVIREDDKNYVRYSASDASSCETMNLGNSEILGNGGEISVETRNIEGRPVKICLRHDLPGDCLVEEILLGKKGEWVTNDFKIPPVTKIGDLYLEIDNYAVGKESRVNDVRDIFIKGNAKYEQNINVMPIGYYTNNQAYREGWVGFKIYDSGFKIQELEHVKVDGWANGFVMNNGNRIMDSGEAEMVIIFYWPQLLQYIGFGLLAMTIVVLMIKRS